MPLSEFDRMHIGHVLQEGTWFTARLLRLLAGADLENRERIRTAYPDEVAAYEEWLLTPELLMEDQA